MVVVNGQFEKLLDLYHQLTQVSQLIRKGLLNQFKEIPFNTSKLQFWGFDLNSILTCHYEMNECMQILFKVRGKMWKQALLF